MAVVTLTFYEYDDPPVDGGATAVGTITDAELEHFAMRKVLSTKGIHNAEVIVNRHDAAADLLVQGRWMTIDIPVLKDDGPILAVRLGPRFETVVSEDEEAGEVVQIGGLGVLSQLKRARLLEEFYAPGQIARGSSPSLPGEWSWREGAGIAYGGIMVRGIEEGQEQPGAPLEHITITFDREDNSAGIAWPHITDEFRQAIGTDVGTLHDRLAEGGRLFLREHADLSIDGFSAFGQDDFGVDRTTASFATGKVLFTVAPDVVSNLLTGLEEEGEEEAYTHVIVEGANGVYVTRTSPSYSSGPGKWGFVSYNDSDDQQLLEDVGDEFLARSADQTQARELEIAPGDDEDNGLYLPVKHFNEGDLVSLSAGPIDEDVRLVAWRLELASATSDADAEAEARSLHIVVETDAITSADSDAPGGLAGPPGSDTPGLCCGPRPPTPPSTSGGGTLRLYPSAHLAGDDATAQSLAAPNLIGADSGSDGDYISTWAARESGEAEWYMMYAEPQDSVSASTMNWAATNDGAAYYPIGAFMVKIGSGTDDPDGRILSIVQGGGSMKVQLRARSRYGTGISESAQNHLLAAAARVYRPGSGFVGTSFALSTIGDLKFAAQATPVNRSGTATLAAVAGAADGDYLCVEFGVQHILPIGGGTGATLAWSDTADTDLPEDQVTTTVLNSWVELTGSGTSSGDTPNPTVLPGDESFGDAGCYAPCGHTHAAGQLSSDGEHFFDASGIEYDGGESGLSATDVQQAIDALAAGAAAGQVSEHEPPFAISAHRGDIGSADSYPENTLEAFRQAAIKGAHRVEIDVQRSSDETWYCIHDTTVDRTTDGTGNVADKTDAQMDALNIDGGEGYDSGRHGTSLNVPTLVSVLDALQPYDIGIDLDLKESADAAHTALAQLVLDRGIQHLVNIRAESLDGAAAIKAVSPLILVGTFTAVTDDPQDEENVDIWWAQRSEVDSLSDVTTRAPDYVQVHVTTGDGVGVDEETWIRAQFGYGVRSYMTNNLEQALGIRQMLLGLDWLVDDGQIGASLAFDDLTDVSASSPTEGEMPRWNGSAWVNDAGLILVDPGSITVDDGTPFGITLTSVWGIDGSTPYYDDSNVDAGDEAALFYDPLTDNYTLIAYDF